MKAELKMGDKELREKGSELAAKLGELYQVRSDKKAVMGEFKARIDRLENMIAVLSDEVRSGKTVKEETFFDDDQIGEE